ncbi:hypothetical protein GGD81_002015 [Rhodobium orientis]|uniref:Cytoplasmic protein n=1 Tax=Rhodobium orientis TaxID=34017 RepID=A0A327K1T0_9HYPH|nr:hypothetical protein [Rhodobium orientis]MBK5949538.1 cytoplasmic protein [Rhodobium orientis]RAI29328.1 cytoplasmic protein [Rhodobium orientis]
MTSTPLMPKATAVWLVDNTALSFEQIAAFCKLHPLEVKAIADGEAAQGIKGLDPLQTGQLTREEIDKAEADPKHHLKLAERKVRVPEARRRGPRYTPVSRRQDRPNAILWLVRNHPEVKDSQIMRLVGTTKPTIQAIRERTHWNAANLSPMDPVTLGLCSQIELDLEVEKAAKNAPRPPVEEAGSTLLSVEETVAPPVRDADVFAKSDRPSEPDPEEEVYDPDQVFAKLKTLKGSDKEVEDANEEETLEEETSEVEASEVEASGEVETSGEESDNGAEEEASSGEESPSEESDDDRKPE